MTHDPLCYMAEGKWDGGCQCPLIARVRADERLQESARRMKKFGYWHDYRPELP